MKKILFVATLITSCIRMPPIKIYGATQTLTAYTRKAAVSVLQVPVLIKLFPYTENCIPLRGSRPGRLWEVI
jgi:hypothetical protein